MISLQVRGCVRLNGPSKKASTCRPLAGALTHLLRVLNTA
jgi:hypothetical protein